MKDADALAAEILTDQMVRLVVGNKHNVAFVALTHVAAAVARASGVDPSIAFVGAALASNGDDAEALGTILRAFTAFARKRGAN